MSDIALPVDQTRAANTIGASDAAAALGLDRYTPPLKLWRQLRGLPVNEDKPAFVEEAADWGKILEPVIRGKYALERNVGVFVPSTSVVCKDWLRCTPDGFVVGSHPGLEHAREVLGVTTELYEAWTHGVVGHARAVNALGLLQVKTCSMYKHDEWASGPPPEHEVQCRVEMAVCDLPWNDITCLIGGQQRVTYRVERDLEIEARIITDLRRFWDSVQSGTEPDVDASAEWRAFASSKMRPTKVAIVPDADMRGEVEAWKRARRILAKAKEEESALKTKLLLRLSAAGATAVDLGAEGKISAYQTAGKGSWKSFAESLGGKVLPEQFKGKPGAWTLRAPWGDDDGEA